MKFLLRLVCLASLLSLGQELRAVEAEEAPVSVKAEVDRAFITIGDPVEYTVTIRRAPSVQTLSAIPSPPAELFRIRKIEDIHHKEGSYTVEGKRYTLTAFRLGEFVLDPVEIQYRIGQGQPERLQTQRLYLTVKSVAEGEEKTDIRGAKSVLALPESFWLVLLLLLALAIAGASAYGIYRRFRKGEGTPSEIPAPLSAEEEALLHLNRLFDSDLLRRGEFKLYYLRLSEILRVYLEKRFHVLAVESTTTEIARLLRETEAARDLQEKILAVLEFADLAKFAKWRPSPAEVLQTNQRSKQIIEESRPQAQEIAGGV